MANNWRYSPRTGTYNAVSITAEAHTIGFDTEANAYGIRLNEAPQLSAPSTVIIAGFTEIAARTAPSAGEFWVDYAADTFTGTGFIEFNAADDTTAITVSYYGLGTVVADSSIVFVSGTQSVTGTKTFTSLVATTADINAGTVDAVLGGTTPAAATVTNLDVSSGGTAQYNSVPVAGYFSDGTPYYIKTVDVQFASSTQKTVAHGISGSPFTNKLVFNVRAVTDDVSSRTGGGEYASGSNNIYQWTLDNTDLTLYTISTGSLLFRATIWYI